MWQLTAHGTDGHTPIIKGSINILSKRKKIRSYDANPRETVYRGKPRKIYIIKNKKNPIYSPRRTQASAPERRILDLTTDKWEKNSAPERRSITRRQIIDLTTDKWKKMLYVFWVELLQISLISRDASKILLHSHGNRQRFLSTVTWVLTVKLQDTCWRSLEGGAYLFGERGISGFQICLLLQQYIGFVEI